MQQQVLEEGSQRRGPRGGVLTQPITLSLLFSQKPVVWLEDRREVAGQDHQDRREGSGMWPVCNHAAQLLLKVGRRATADPTDETWTWGEVVWAGAAAPAWALLVLRTVGGERRVGVDHRRGQMGAMGLPTSIL